LTVPWFLFTFGTVGVLREVSGNCCHLGCLSTQDLHWSWGWMMNGKLKSCCHGVRRYVAYLGSDSCSSDLKIYCCSAAVMIAMILFRDIIMAGIIITYNNCWLYHRSAIKILLPSIT
jgi:hypothetical protein